MKKLIPFLISALFLCNCTRDNNGELPDPNCNTSMVSFSSTVSGIINTHCLGCHGANNPSAGFSLNTYNGVKAKVDDGRLFGAINHSPGFTPMPEGSPKLSQCDINKIKAWIDAGALNN